MTGRIILAVTTLLIIGIMVALPVLSEERPGEAVPVVLQPYDEAAVRTLINYYEAAFNERDIEWRMSLCLDTYTEYGFENGNFIQALDYEATEREVGGYWANLDSLEYAMDDIEVQLDGPVAFVKANTTHLAPDDRHTSTVHFALVKIDGAWRIAWDSYNIVSRFDD